VQSSSQIVTTNKPTSSFFYRLDALPVAQPTVSRALKEMPQPTTGTNHYFPFQFQNFLNITTGYAGSAEVIPRKKLWCLLKQRVMEVVSGDNWSYKTCKAPVKSSPPTNQHPVSLWAGCPSCRPTNSVRALKGNLS